MKRVSIKDVAKTAGVSVSTVSYVLNQTHGQTISSETSQRVWDAAHSLHYVANLNARSLSSNRTNLIGVVIPQTEPGKAFMFSNPFYGELLSSLEWHARESGFHLLLSGPGNDQSYIQIAQNRRVDGIVIVGSYPTKRLNELHQLSLPVVLIDTYVKDPEFHTIGIDDRAGGREAVEHLIANGHRKIAFVSGSVGEDGVNQRRYQGYCEAMKKHNLPMDESWLYMRNVSFDSGAAAAQILLQRDESITAAFATADVLGMGLVKGMQQCGKKVPDDFSVVSFDDLDLALMCNPSLTTIHQDVAGKGQHAVRIIMEALEGNKDKQETILPIHLVQRDSVAALPGGAST